MSRKSSEQVSALIRADDIDILIDLNGLHTRYARPEVLLSHPGKVQVSFLGYLWTSARKDVFDFTILDMTVLPPAGDGIGPFKSSSTLWFSERIAYMPPKVSFLPCSHARIYPTALADANKQGADEHFRKAMGLPAQGEGIIFANFGQHIKISKRTWKMWMKILKKVPKSVLWLIRFPKDSERQLLSRAKAQNIHTDRLVFSAMFPRGKHLAAKSA